MISNMQAERPAFFYAILKMTEIHAMPRNQKKDMRTSVLIGVLFIAFCPVEILLWLEEGVPVWARLLNIVLIIALGIGMIVVLRERIHELRGGETDDLDNY